MTDAFKHLPALRGRITPPEKSELRATREVLALWEPRAGGRLAAVRAGH
jgi:cation transport protein ChaC